MQCFSKAHGPRFGRPRKQKRELGSTLFFVGAGDRTCKEVLRGDGIASKASVPNFGLSASLARARRGKSVA